MMLEYDLCIDDARTHTYDVTLTVKAPAARQRVSLPVWIPGSYLVREFAKHLSGLRAIQKGRAVKVVQLDKCTWEVDCLPEQGPLVLNWQVYALDRSVRMAYLDPCRGFVNGTGVFLRVHGRELDAVQLTVAAKDRLAHGWSVACALPVSRGKGKEGAVKKTGAGKRVLAVLKAASYDELVDSPLEMGYFWQGRFKAAGVVHEFVVAAAPDGFDGKRLLADVQKICEAQIVFWHGQQGVPPFKRYVFMLNAVGDGYGGLEHCASTALICKRADLPMKGDAVDAQQVRPGYQQLLGLVSHEYFHAWNVKRMRPAELARYDYARENYTELLWFFEGFTSYYDDLFLLRCGLVTPQQYVDLLCRNINAVESMPGRFKQSVAQASFDAWVKYYRVDENTANATVSYYTKGALVALCLDLTLRSEVKKGLDEVMRLLWKSSGGGPITENDIARALKQVSGRSFAKELREWVHGVQDLPVEKLLRCAGVDFGRKAATLPQELGMLVVPDAGCLKVKTVLDGSAAQKAGVAAGDEIVGVNGWRLHHLDDWKVYASGVDDAQVLIARDAQMMNVILRMGGTRKAQSAAGGSAALVLQPLSQRKKLKPGLRFWPQK